MPVNECAAIDQMMVELVVDPLQPLRGPVAWNPKIPTLPDGRTLRSLLSILQPLFCGRLTGFLGLEFTRIANHKVDGRSVRLLRNAQAHAGSLPDLLQLIGELSS